MNRIAYTNSGGHDASPIVLRQTGALIYQICVFPVRNPSESDANVCWGCTQNSRSGTPSWVCSGRPNEWMLVLPSKVWWWKHCCDCRYLDKFSRMYSTSTYGFAIRHVDWRRFRLHEYWATSTKRSNPMKKIAEPTPHLQWRMLKVQSGGRASKVHMSKKGFQPKNWTNHSAMNRI